MPTHALEFGSDDGKGNPMVVAAWPPFTGSRSSATRSAAEEFGCFFTAKSDLVLPFHAATDVLKKDGFLDHLDMRWFFLNDPPAK